MAGSSFSCRCFVSTNTALLEEILLGEALDAIEPAHLLHNSLCRDVIEIRDLVELLFDELSRNCEGGIAT